MDHDLEVATREYLLRHIVVNVQKQVITLPKIMEWYSKDFRSNQDKLGLIRWVLEFLEKNEALVMGENIDTDFNIVFDKFDWSCEYFFKGDYLLLEHMRAGEWLKSNGRLLNSTGNVLLETTDK